MRKRRTADRKERTDSESRNDEGRRDVDVAHVMRADSADAFIRNPDDGGPVRVDDDLAETLAEEYVHAATSGEDQDEDTLDQMVPEEIGGPFVETSAEEEFADGTDESNPEDAEVEGLPRAVGGISGRPRE
jgi:hypothetical protein